jgi:hypothetical protein
MDAEQIERVMRLSLIRREALTGNGDPTQNDGHSAADDPGEEDELHQVDSQNRKSEG